MSGTEVCRDCGGPLLFSQRLSGRLCRACQCTQAMIGIKDPVAFVKAADAAALMLPLMFDRETGSAFFLGTKSEFEEYVKQRGKIPDDPPPKPEILYRCVCGMPVDKNGQEIPGLTLYKDIAKYLNDRIKLEEKEVRGFCCPKEES